MNSFVWAFRLRQQVKSNHPKGEGFVKTVGMGASVYSSKELAIRWRTDSFLRLDSSLLVVPTTTLSQVLEVPNEAGFEEEVKVQ